jgi:hypothetical protein
MMYPPIAQIALESRFTVMSRQVLIQLKATNLIPAISREIGLTAARLGKCRARCSARCHAPGAAHRVSVRAAARGCFASTRCLLFIRHLPVAGSFI